MSQPPIGVLALQGDVREHARALAASGARPVPVRRAEELDTVAGIIIPGGESTTISRLLDVFELREPLLKRLIDGLPAYGSCAGMIMLADKITDGRDDQYPLGGLDVVVRRNAFGRQVDSFEADLPFVGVAGPPVRGVFIRAPWVERVGPAAEVLARIPSVAGETATSEQTGLPGRVVAVRQANMLATAFHPELTGDNRVHALFVRMVVAAGDEFEQRMRLTSKEAIGERPL